MASQTPGAGRAWQEPSGWVGLQTCVSSTGLGAVSDGHDCSHFLRQSEGQSGTCSTWELEDLAPGQLSGPSLSPSEPVSLFTMETTQ